MPSPVGHALGGLTAAFIVNAFARRPHLTLPLLAGAAVISISPDLDLLVGSHRTFSHSVGAVIVVFVGCWVAFRKRPSSLEAAAVLAAAYASHMALDWLSKDTSYPSGLTALWPFTSTYYKSGLDLFGEISRRYWRPEEFIVGNMKAAAWECALLTPLLVAAWVFWSKRTLVTKNEKRKSNRARPTR